MRGFTLYNLIQPPAAAYADIIQSTIIISKSKGLSEILRDIRTSTYRICRTEEKLKRKPHFTNEYVS